MNSIKVNTEFHLRRQRKYLMILTELNTLMNYTVTKKIGGLSLVMQAIYCLLYLQNGNLEM